MILNRSLVENTGKSAGDQVTLTVNGQTYQYEVIGIDKWPFDTIFFEWSELAVLAGYTGAAGVPNPGTLLIDLASEQDGEATAHDIQAVYANQRRRRHFGRGWGTMGAAPSNRKDAK